MFRWKKSRIFIVCLLLLILLTPCLWVYLRDVYLIEKLESSNLATRSRAILLLETIGKEEQVLPIFVKMLNDPDDWVRRDSAYALCKIGKAAFPELKKVLQYHPNYQVRLSVIDLIAGLARQAKAKKVYREDLIPLLMIALNDSKKYNCNVASIGLICIGRPAIPFLIQAMKAKELESEYGLLFTIMALGSIELDETESSELFPILIEIIQSHSSLDCRSQALWTLKSLEPSYYQKAIPILKELLEKNSNDSFSYDIKQTIKRLEEK